MKLSELSPRMRVAYLPGHAHGDMHHPDVEHGTVSSLNDKFAFVRFDRQVKMFGWDQTTAQACDPSDLVMLYD